MAKFAGYGLTCSCKALAVLGLCCVVVGRAEAGVITETGSYHYATHGTTVGTFNQLNPSLVPLNEVDEIYRGTESVTYWFANNTGNAITFTATARFLGAPQTTVSLTTTLQSSSQPVLETLSAPYYYFQRDLPNSNNNFLAAFIGTSQAAPRPDSGPVIVSVDDPRISMTFIGSDDFGTDDVIFFFGPNFGPVPEPASIVMMTIGLAAVAGLAWLRRSA